MIGDASMLWKICYRVRKTDIDKIKIFDRDDDLFHFYRNNKSGLKGANISWKRCHIYHIYLVLWVQYFW